MKRVTFFADWWNINRYCIPGVEETQEVRHDYPAGTHDVPDDIAEIALRHPWVAVLGDEEQS